jgi:hypothetical protein
MKSWIAVASSEHVARGVAGSYMQVCHGKCGPLKRIQPGDWVVYYSPSTQMGGKDKLQSFTAIGIARAGAPYLFDMGGGFIPYRRDVDWLPAQPAAILPLLEQLDFYRGIRNWGAPFRFGLFAISQHDIQTIAEAMAASSITFHLSQDTQMSLF